MEGRSGPACSAAARSSTCSPATGTTSSRCDPTDDYGFCDGTWGPGRIDTGQQPDRDGGAHDAYQDQKRYKPQVYVSLSYFKDGWDGSHDFKVGYDWKRDRRSFVPRPAVRHLLPRSERRRGERARHLQHADVTGINDVVYQAVWHQRHLEVQQSPHVQPRRALRALRRQLPRSGVHAERHAALPTGRTLNPTTHALPGLHRAAHRRGARRRRHHRTSRRASASPTT